MPEPSYPRPADLSPLPSREGARGRGIHLGIHLTILSTLTLLSTPVFADDNMDDVLGEFETLDSFEDVETSGETVDPYAWDFGGSLSVSAGYNLEDHASSTDTDYSGLSKLRARVNLSLDKKFSNDWRISLNGYAWHDFAYEIQDEAYTDDVLDEYETQAEIMDAYVQGKLGERWDLWVGRQVAVWGFADNLRVLDVLNPLDNLEPAIADIEDLRRPVGMLRLNHFRGPWTLGLYAIPEQRFSRNPPFGSDFYTITDANGQAVKFREEQPDDFDEIDYAASLVGRFSGWDLSFNAARQWYDEPYLDPRAFDVNDPNASNDTFNESVVLRHSRITMGGFGVQKTWGSWLFKQEAAVYDGLLLTNTGPVTVNAPLPLIGTLPIIGPLLPGASVDVVIPHDVSEHRQANLLLGVEYYGFTSTSIGIEIAGRYLDDFNDEVAASGYVEKRTESSLRVTRDFLREKLRSTLVLIFFDQDRLGKDGGAIYRLNLDYELGPALELSGGAVFYDGGDQQPFGLWTDNDRVFTEIKWSF
mgnify:CR=1 FL=1